MAHAGEAKGGFRTLKKREGEESLRPVGYARRERIEEGQMTISSSQITASTTKKKKSPAIRGASRKPEGKTNRFCRRITI